MQHSLEKKNKKKNEILSRQEIVYPILKVCVSKKKKSAYLV